MQLNYGVVWYTASRRLADTLSALSEKVRGGPVWDQMVFAHMFTMPSSRVSPWSGRHTLRVMDPLVFPNTCEDQLQGALFVHPRLYCSFHPPYLPTLPSAILYFAGNLNWLLTKQDIAKMRPVLLHFNCRHVACPAFCQGASIRHHAKLSSVPCFMRCSPPESRRDIMMTVWQAFQQHRAYLMAARSCPTEAITCRPEHLNATKPSP